VDRVALHDQRVVGLLHRFTHLVPLLLLHEDHVGHRRNCYLSREIQPLLPF
jgi:hypothetical protein